MDNVANFASHVLPAEVRQTAAPLLDRYVSGGARDMTAEQTKPAWYASEKVIPSLLTALIALIGIIYLGMRSDIDELKKDAREIVKHSSEIRVDLVKAIGAVEKQGAATNARLDQLIADGRQRR